MIPCKNLGRMLWGGSGNTVREDLHDCRPGNWEMHHGYWATLWRMKGMWLGRWRQQGGGRPRDLRCRWDGRVAKGKEEDMSSEGVLGDEETQDQWKLRKHRAKAWDGVREALGVDSTPGYSPALRASSDEGAMKRKGERGRWGVSGKWCPR